MAKKIGGLIRLKLMQGFGFQGFVARIPFYDQGFDGDGDDGDGGGDGDAALLRAEPENGAEGGGGGADRWRRRRSLEAGAGAAAAGGAETVAAPLDVEGGGGNACGNAQVYLLGNPREVADRGFGVRD